VTTARIEAATAVETRELRLRRCSGGYGDSFWWCWW